MCVCAWHIDGCRFMLFTKFYIFANMYWYGSFLAGAQHKRTPKSIDEIQTEFVVFFKLSE